MESTGLLALLQLSSVLVLDATAGARKTRESWAQVAKEEKDTSELPLSDLIN